MLSLPPVPAVSAARSSIPRWIAPTSWPISPTSGDKKWIAPVKSWESSSYGSASWIPAYQRAMINNSPRVALPAWTLLSPLPEINGYVSLLRDSGAVAKINPACKALALRVLERMGLSLYSFRAPEAVNAAAQ